MSNLVRFDWAMKFLLRRKVNFVVLEGFLSELLDEEVKIEEILESQSNKDHPNDKYNQVDLLVRTSKKEQVIIEVQCHQEWDFLSRMLYASSKTITENIDSGDSYHKIPRVISVNIVYFEIGHGKDYLYHGTTSFKGRHYSDILELNEKEKNIYDTKYIKSLGGIFPEYYIIRVDLFNNNRIRDKVDEWVYFLKNSKIKPEFSAKGLQEASKRLDIGNLDLEQRRLYKKDSENLSLENSLIDSAIITGKVEGRKEGLEEGRKEGLEEGRKEGLEEGLKEGLEEGLKEGKKEKTLEFAKKLLGKKISIEEVADLTGLSAEEIKEIK